MAARGAHDLIEKSANGAEIIDALKNELPGVLPVTASTDKITRAIAASPPLESLPNGKHDDQVDAYSQAINWARNQSTTPARLYVPQGRLPDNLYALGLTSAASYPSVVDRNARFRT